MTVVAVREGPAIICPSWCQVTTTEHLGDLPGLEGVTIHWSESAYVDHAEGQAQTEVRVTRVTYVDGVRDNSDGPADLIYVDDTAYTEAQALQLAQLLTDAVGTARA